MDIATRKSGLWIMNFSTDLDFIQFDYTYTWLFYSRLVHRRSLMQKPTQVANAKQDQRADGNHDDQSFLLPISRLMDDVMPRGDDGAAAFW